MFIKETIIGPRMADGRKFLERTIESKFGDRKVAITTISMDNKPLIKKYVFDEPNVIKNYWKSLTKGVVDSHRTWKNPHGVDYLA